jgi:hypothetical protein
MRLSAQITLARQNWFGAKKTSWLSHSANKGENSARYAEKQSYAHTTHAAYYANY